MSYYRCTYCGGIHMSYTKCPKKKPPKQKRQSEDFYNSTEWKKVRFKVKHHFNFVDIWELGKTGNVVRVPKGIVHHIEEYQKDKDLQLEFSNLVYVSIPSHNEIHMYYDTFRKDEAVKIIRLGIERYEELIKW